jgi:hypothetical protein
MQSNFYSRLLLKEGRQWEQFYEAHPPSGCSTTTPKLAPHPGKEGIKQVNKQPPNRPNFLYNNNCKKIP